jgi:hypothetical protein
MYKMCDRCRFSVPAKQVLCHVCGSREFVSDETPALKPIEASLKNCKDTVGGAFGKMQSAFNALGREIEETAHKAQRATDSMRKLIFEAGSDHDKVLSFHRSIGAGRNVQFAPVGFNSANGALETIVTDRSRVSGTKYLQDQLTESNSGVSNFVSDDALFSPTVSFVEYMAAHSVLVDTTPDSAALVDNCAHELPDFFSKNINLQPVVLVAPAQALEKIQGESEDVDSLRKNIDELKGWFESFGKEGPLVKDELALAKPADKADAESTKDESELAHSQAA